MDTRRRPTISGEALIAEAMLIECSTALSLAKVKSTTAKMKTATAMISSRASWNTSLSNAKVNFFITL